MGPDFVFSGFMMKNFKIKPSEYKIVEKLFEGQNCSVFKVLREDAEANWSHCFALKVLHSKSQISDCIEEFGSLIQVRSSNCVQVYSWEWINDKPALLLELVDGLNLQQLMQRKKLGHEIKNYILNEVYMGLHDLNKQGLAHGDLSPKNIMISKKGEIKLIDYGLANFFGTQTKFTPGFVAPEIMNGEKPDFKSDLYSLGCIMRHLSLIEEAQLSLLAIDRNKREYKKRKHTNRMNFILGELVQQASVVEVPSTQRIFEVKHEASRKNLFYRMLLSGSLSFALVGASSRFEPAHLSAKTEKWVRLKIWPEALVVDSPFDNLDLAPGEHQIEWQSATGSGSFKIVLKEAQLHCLKKSDFLKAHR